MTPASGQTRLVWWLLAGFLPSLLLGWGTLQVFGAAAPGTTLGLKLTARWAYIFFWLAYAGGPLAMIFGSRFVPLARRARELGLAFVAAMVPHTALVAWIFYISATAPMSERTIAFFLVALALAYLLALLSFRIVADRFPATAVRCIRLVGVEYIALAFLRDFVVLRKEGGHLAWLTYDPFIALAMGAAILRIVSWCLRSRLSAVVNVHPSANRS